MMRPRPQACLAAAALFAICLSPGCRSSPRRGPLSPPAAASARAPAAPLPGAWDAQAVALYRELIAINTAAPRGTTEAAEAMGARLREAGFAGEDVLVLGPDPKKKNLVARLRGTGTRRPLLMMAHLDVVEARREDWTYDPFTLTELGGYFYGRGALDDKAMAALWVAVLIRLKKEGARPDRDLIVALTADEEEGPDNGALWLVKEQRPLIDAAYCLNEGGGGEIRNGAYLVHEIQRAEKIETRLALEVKDRGGLSAEPRPGNAIYRLSAALVRVAAYQFPARLSDVTRDYFGKMAATDRGAAQADLRALSAPGPIDAGAADRLSALSPWFNALLRTTCTPTLLEAGHAEAALPQSARVTLDCRLLPDERPDDVTRKLRELIADPGVEIIIEEPPAPNPTSPPLPELDQAFEKATRALWPGVLVAQTMLHSSTDGRHLRAAGIPTYGVSGLFVDIDDEREHGKDERILVKSFHEAREFLYRLVRDLSDDATRR